VVVDRVGSEGTMTGNQSNGKGSDGRGVRYAEEYTAARRIVVVGRWLAGVVQVHEEGLFLIEGTGE